MSPVLTRRSLTTTLAGVAAMVLLAACGGSSSGGSSDKVRFGYINDFNGASLIAIAEAEGLWKKHGLSADAKVFTNGPLQIQALGTDNLDFGYIGPGAMWLPASGQAKVVAINTLGNSDRVLAQPGITSMQQLKGKTVAVPEGTSGDMILSLALEKAGMTKEDLKVVPMDPSTIVSAFSSQQVDAPVSGTRPRRRSRSRCPTWSNSPRTPTSNRTSPSPPPSSRATRWWPTSRRRPRRSSPCCARR